MKIERSSEQQRWIIPAKGGCNFLLVFAAIWLSITGVFLMAGFDANSANGLGSWGIGFMKGAFALVGLIVLWIGLRMSFLKHELEIIQEELHYRRQFFGHTKHLAWPLHSVQSVELKEFYQQNYRPVHGIEIRGSLGKIRFGSQLTVPEKEALLTQLKQALFAPPPPMTETAAAAMRHEDLHTGIPLPEVDPLTGFVRIDAPGKWHPVLVFMGLIFLLVPGFMLSQGLGMVGDGAPWFFQAFGIFWCLGPAVGALAGIVILYAAWKLKFTNRLIEVTPSGIRYSEATSRQTVVTTWDAKEFRCAIVAPIGATNGTPNWRGEILLETRVLPFGWNRSKEDLQALTNAINSLLKAP